MFFLDEATALAAGHRPCFFCRRDDAHAFRAAWAKGQGVKCPRARDMDAMLHGERLSGRTKRLHDLPLPPDALPDGAMVQAGADSFLIVKGQPLLWAAAGYRMATALQNDARLLTPPSILRALMAGYRPALHPSARA